MKGYFGQRFISGYRLALASVAAALLVFPAGRAEAQKKGEKAKQEDAYVMSEAELQSQVMSFADRLAMFLSSAFSNYERQSPPARQRREIAIDTVYTLASAYTIAAETDPDGGLLDMVSMISLGRIVYEQDRLKRFGESLKPLVEAYRAAEADIWFLAAQLMTELQQREMRQVIEEWRRTYPTVDNYYYVRFADFSEQRRGSMLAKSGAVGGIFKSVSKLTREVEEFRILSERGLFLVSRMPLLSGLFADVWVSRVANNPEVKRVLDDINRFSQVSDRFAIVAENLPADLAEEREQIIAQAMLNANRLSVSMIETMADKFAREREVAIKQLIREFSLAREQAIADMLAEEDRIKSLLSELRQTLESAGSAATATNTLMERLNVGRPRTAISDESNAAAKGRAKPVDIKDIESILVKSAGVADRMNRILTGLDQLMGSQGWQQTLPQLLQAAETVQQEGRAWITRMIIVGIVLIFAGCIGVILTLLVYRFVSERYLTGSGPPSAQ